MAEKRITKNDKFEMIKEIVLATEVDNKDELVEFIEKEQANLIKKKGTKTQAQKDNEVIIEAVYDALKEIGERVTVTQLLKTIEIEGIASNQKLSAMLKKLVDSNRVVKTIEKKVSYFEVA